MVNTKITKMNKLILMVSIVSLLLASMVLVQAQSNFTADDGGNVTSYNDYQNATVKESRQEVKQEIKQVREQTKQDIQELKESGNNLLIEIAPEKNKVSVGEKAQYTITVKDGHEISTMKCKDEKCMTSYSYKISIDKSEKLSYGLETSEITLSAGEKKQIKLSLNSQEKGEYIFTVLVTGDDSNSRAKARGILIVDGQDESMPVDSSFFMGKGFALSFDESLGNTVDLKILQQNNLLKGKMSLANQVYRIDGTLDGDNVDFSLSKPEANETSGSFLGSVKKFENFLLLRGSLTIDGQDYSLTAMSENNLVFKNLEVQEEKKAAKIKLGEITLVNENISESNMTYIRPLDIQKEKILGIIPDPWGKKVLNVEFMDEGKVKKEKLREMEEKNLGEYQVKATSLEDENNIELDIEKQA
jgi:hypothetical protein